MIPLSDPTEAARRRMVDEINETPRDRAELEKSNGEIWDTNQLTAEFDVDGFLAPYVSVIRKRDGAKGLMLFQHQPRFYFGFTESRWTTQNRK